MIRTGSAYIRATPLPHLTAGLCLVLAALVAKQAHFHWCYGMRPAACLIGALAGPFLFSAMLSLADAASRYREYGRFKALFLKYGPKPLILKTAAGSRCRRDAALAAARDAGIGSAAREFFRLQGYRWYHLMPDRVAGDPLFLLSPRFLRSSLVPGKKSPALSPGR
jgi:hypothetical protein